MYVVCAQCKAFEKGSNVPKPALKMLLTFSWAAKVEPSAFRARSLDSVQTKNVVEVSIADTPNIRKRVHQNSETENLN
jgi:hypothetical protein